MRRPDGSTTCAKGLHPWVEENIYTNPKTGYRTCKPCKKVRKDLPPEQRHSKGSNHCKRGHEYTPENTQKRVKIVNGEKQYSRTCMACKRYEGANNYYGTGVNR